MRLGLLPYSRYMCGKTNTNTNTKYKFIIRFSTARIYGAAQVLPLEGIRFVAFSHTITIIQKTQEQHKERTVVLRWYNMRLNFSSLFSLLAFEDFPPRAPKFSCKSAWLSSGILLVSSLLHGYHGYHGGVVRADHGYQVPSLEAIRSQSSIELLFCRVYPVTGGRSGNLSSHLPRRTLNEARSSAVFTLHGRVFQSRAALQANELWYFVATETCVVVGDVGTSTFFPTQVAHPNDTFGKLPLYCFNAHDVQDLSPNPSRAPKLGIVSNERHPDFNPIEEVLSIASALAHFFYVIFCHC
eukprot:sb/3467409/